MLLEDWTGVERGLEGVLVGMLVAERSRIRSCLGKKVGSFNGRTKKFKCHEYASLRRNLSYVIGHTVAVIESGKFCSS